jgi:hypothetical protein
LTATYSGSITPFGSVAASWNDFPLKTPDPQYLNLGSIEFTDGFVNAANNPLILDNVFLVPVPEPSTWALLLGGVLMLAGQHRRHHARRRLQAQARMDHGTNTAR